jgi:hypothetical protein
MYGTLKGKPLSPIVCAFIITRMCPVQDGSLIAKGYPSVLLDVAQPTVEMKVMSTSDLHVLHIHQHLLLINSVVGPPGSCHLASAPFDCLAIMS